MNNIIGNCPLFILEIPKEDNYVLEINDIDDVIFELEVSEEGILPYYNDDYEITPRVYEQTMATKNHSMRQDVVVHEIPKAEVSNIYGKTVSIG